MSSLVRFLMCGSVDDGKSTLIGRLLYESKLLHTDHLAALEADSAQIGTQGGELDLALVVDGLVAEREQGITIDVAYRYFTTEQRRFVVADAPGHEQYTRNMVTGASTADAAVVLVDARHGVLTQTRRHARLLALLGVRNVALAVNKLDLLDYSRERFEQISEQFRRFAADLGFAEVLCTPVSAVRGDNVVTSSAMTPWYSGPSLLGWLEQIEVADTADEGPCRFLVQWVVRPDESFRGYAGRVLGGVLRRGDRVVVTPGGTVSTVDRIVTLDGDRDEAVAGASVTVVLTGEVDVSRGDLLAAANSPTDVAESFRAHLVWMDEDAMLPGRQYRAKLGARALGVTVDVPEHRIDVDSGDHVRAEALRSNEIAQADVHFDAPVGYEPYGTNRDLGSFLVIDRFTNNTVAAGMIERSLSRGRDLAWQRLTVDRQARAARNAHRPCVVWLTGLSGAGKSTIADLAEKALHAEGWHTFLLDGDNVRHGLTKDLGFTDADRVENVRRVAEVAALMADAGLIVLVSFISPFRAEREDVRARMAPEEFCEVHVDTPLEVAEQRDPKGLYSSARRGELANFTGIDSPYEPPHNPELRIDTTAQSPEQAAAVIVEELRARTVLPGRSAH